MDWMDPLPRKKAKTPRRIKRESAMGGSRCHISPTTSHSSARGNPTLIKTVINKAACCRGGAREQIKNSFWGCSRGDLVWCLNLTGWITATVALSSAQCCENIEDLTELTFNPQFILIITPKYYNILQEKKRKYVFMCCYFIKYLNLPGRKLTDDTETSELKVFRTARKKRIAFPSAQMESDIWRSG